MTTELTQPAVLPRDTPVLDAALGAFERIFGRRPLVVRAGGTLPILATLAAHGIPTILAGLGLPDSHTHSPNERMLLETFPLGVAAAQETYRALGALPCCRRNRQAATCETRPVAEARGSRSAHTSGKAWSRGLVVGYPPTRRARCLRYSSRLSGCALVRRRVGGWPATGS